MSTINQIQLPNGSTYDFEDTAAREAASNHSHSNYVAKAGDTMTGALKLTKGSTAGCTLDYDATNRCLSFVFS